MTVTFTAQLEKFADLSKRKIELVFKESAQDVFEAALLPKGQGGNMPVKDGHLRNTSQVAGVNGAQNLSGENCYTLALIEADLGDSIFMGWTAAYALRMEYGFVGTDSRGRTYNQPGNHFALNASQQWPAIVARNVAKAQALKG